MVRSIHRTLGRVLALAGASAALQATSCGGRELRNDRFDLATCPPATFALPPDVRDGPYHLASESRESGWPGGALDTTFAAYAFTDIGVAGLGPRPVALRLVRGSTCSLDLLRAAHGPDSLSTVQAEAIARMAASSGGTRALAPGRHERIRVDELRAWMKRTAASAP